MGQVVAVSALFGGDRRRGAAGRVSAVSELSSTPREDRVRPCRPRPRTIIVTAHPRCVRKPFLRVRRAFVAKKNVPFPIDAYARYLVLAGDTTRPLVLVGAGDEEPAIRAAIARHALGDRVTIKGFLQPDGVARRL